MKKEIVEFLRINEDYLNLLKEKRKNLEKGSILLELEQKLWEEGVPKNELFFLEDYLMKNSDPYFKDYKWF